MADQEDWQAVPEQVVRSIRLACALGVKAAEAPLAPLRRAFDAPQKLMGGPTPLSSMLVGGLLGSGLGYAGGKLIEHFLPEDQFEPGALSRSLALTGGLAGAAPGAWWWSGNARSDLPDVHGALQGLMSQYPYRPQDFPKGAADVQERHRDPTGLFARTIPVDAFNRAVWNDVSQAPNPYGTKSPWGDNTQPLTTPPPVAAAATGIVSGVGALTGQTHVSPWEVGLAAASTAGKGYLTGMVFGKALGFLAGLSPQAQQTLQRTGLWAGALTGAVETLFGH